MLDFTKDFIDYYQYIIDVKIDNSNLVQGIPNRKRFWHEKMFKVRRRRLLISKALLETFMPVIHTTLYN